MTSIRQMIKSRRQSLVSSNQQTQKSQDNGKNKSGIVMNGLWRRRVLTPHTNCVQLGMSPGSILSWNVGMKHGDTKI